jgi:hypothetical protein
VDINKEIKDKEDVNEVIVKKVKEEEPYKRVKRKK